MTHKVESQIHYKMDTFPECDVEIRPNVANPSQCIKRNIHRNNYNKKIRSQ